jgi:hypothetical protein
VQNTFRIILTTFLFILTSLSALAQETNESGLRVYIDCNSCDMTFFRQEIPYIAHVRDQDLSDVLVFIRRITNGGGGRTYKLSFTGRNEFETEQNELTFNSDPTQTQDEIREGLLRYIVAGLIPYLMDTSLSDRIEVLVTDTASTLTPSSVTEDRWKHWIFEVGAEGGLEKESRRSETDFETGISADRITEDWKIRSRAEINYGKDRFEPDGDEPDIISIIRRHYFRSSIVYSLGRHWSAGVFGDIDHDTYDNIDLAWNAAPAVEFSIYPYSEVVRREITISYHVGYTDFNYIDTTIFNRKEEGRFRQSLDLRVRFRQPWGSIFARLEGRTFLDDLSKNSLELDSFFDIRILKGLALRVSADVELIRDQISLPKGDASIQDLLLRQRQIATDFEMRFGIGLSYTFGSAFNNIINTRL